MPFLFVLLLAIAVVNCNCSLIGFESVEPGDNGIVNKYHTSLKLDDNDYLKQSLTIHIVPGVVVGVIFFLISSVYFAHRCCSQSSCFRCMKKKKRGRGRSGSWEREMKQYTLIHPAVSWALRGSLLLIFILVIPLIVIGILGSSSLHTQVTEALQVVNDSASTINATIYKTSFTLDNLIGINYTIPNDTLSELMENGNNIANQANKVNSVGPHVDSVRNTTTVVIYFIVSIPMLLGAIAAIFGKGRFAFIMSATLPIGLIAMWILFSFQYAVFIVNVDACYAIDDFLINSDYNNTDSNPLSFIFDCSSLDIVAPVLDTISLAINETGKELAQSRNQTYNELLITQLASLYTANNNVEGLKGCTALATLMFSIYQTLCGNSVQASLFLWQSQIGLGVVLALALVLGLISEYRIGRQKKQVGAPLLSLVE
jgi:hypothetical protein